MKLAIYAHFSSKATVAKHVLHYLQHIRELGFEICFVSNSPISKACELKLKDLCGRVILRENEGYDFTMWKVGMAEFDLSKVDELLLTNSSIIGPLQPLASLWQNPAVATCDFWGLTDNKEVTPHLQSYFLVFKQKVIQSKSFSQFWAAILPYSEKYQVILSYEIGLTRWFIQNGFIGKPLFPQEKTFKEFLGRRSLIKKIKGRITQRRLLGENTTVYYPRILLDAGMPFLKAVLLRPGPYPDSGNALELLQDSQLPQDALKELRSDGDR